METTFEIQGIDELLRKLDNEFLLGQALRDIFTKSTFTIQKNVQMRTKVDMDRLRSSITSEIDAASLPQWGKVGTQVTYGIFVEEDTHPHFPPIAAIEPWAHRHNMIPFLVALGISKHGTKGAHMFRDGLEASKGDIDGFVSEAAGTIEEKFGE